MRWGGRTVALCGLALVLAALGCGSSGDDTAAALVDAGVQIDVALLDAPTFDVRADAADASPTDSSRPDSAVDGAADATADASDASDAQPDAPDAADANASDAADAADALPPPDGSVSLRSGGTVAGASFAKSASYKLISTVGGNASPPPASTSSQYRLHGGVVGANGAKP